LAIALHAEFPDKQLEPEVVQIAMSSLAALKDINLPAPILRCDPGLSGTGASYYDWRSDTMIIRR